MRIRRILLRPLHRAALVTLLATTAPVVAAQDAAPRTFADTATASVKDAAASAWDMARDLTSSALGLIGVRYKWGGTDPAKGLDCSGLVQYVFQQVTGVTLPRSAKAMSTLGDTVTLAELAPGDLVFFNTRHFAYSHVGIYLGDNRFIHAPRRGRDVEVTTIDKSYWQKHFNGARRLVGVLPEMMPALVTEASAAPFAAPEPVDATGPAAASPQP
jgi:cell wall-associated NlpC family hydrolase